MTRRRLLVLVLPVALVLLGVAVWAIVDADARAIQPGMTREEVEAVLGKPNIISGHGPGYEDVTWSSHSISVYFDPDGIAVSVHRATWHERLRRRLGW
jgi:hypothetical protein